jgi:GNAT superfamily N-acetyltransferase
MEIVELDAAGVERHADELAQLLLDAHASNMALGLSAPLTRTRAADEWRRMAASLVPGSRILLGALDDEGRLVGAVHLARAHVDNGSHRAEVQRLVVRTERRGAGIGAALLDALADRARDAGITLLWLTTHAETDSDAFYVRRGWTRVGVIPGYSVRPDGTLADNAFFYRRLG